MIAGRLPLFNGRLKSDVDSSSTEPRTMTDTLQADWRGTGRRDY